MRRTTNSLLILVNLVVAAPLSAQQTVVVPDVNVDIENVIDSIGVILTVELPSPDSAQVARDEAAQRAMDAIATYLEDCGCVNAGPTTINVLTNAGLTLAAFFIGWQIKRLADRDPDVHNDGDTKVEVTVPPHDHPSDDYDDRGES